MIKLSRWDLECMTPGGAWDLPADRCVMSIELIEPVKEPKP